MCGIRNPGKFRSWNSESWALQSGIQLKESGIPLTIRFQNPSSTDCNPLPGIRGDYKAWNPESKIVLDSFTLSIAYLFTRQSAIKSKKNCLISRLNKKDDNATDDDDYDILLVLFYEERIKKTLLLLLILMQINPFCFTLFLC